MKYILEVLVRSKRKLNVLVSLTNYMKLPKGRILMSAFLKPQFNDCPIVWMFHSHSLNNKVNQLHEIFLRTIHNDCNWTGTHNHLVHKGTLNHLASLASLAKWLGVRLSTKWLWVLVQLHSLQLQILCLLRARGSLTFRQL